MGVSGIARDIRGRVRAERKLRESEERFREIFEHAPFGMCVTGLDGRFIQVNAALCRMLGYSEQELLGTPWAQLTHPDDLAPFLRWIEQWRQEPEACRGCGKTLHSPRWKCRVGAREDLAGTRLRRQPVVLCGPRGRHHGAQARGGGAARE